MEVGLCFIPLPLYPLGERLRYPLNSRLCGSQSQFGCFGEDRNLQPLTGTEQQLLSCPSCNIVILLTDYPGPLQSWIMHFLLNSHLCFWLFLFSFIGLSLCLRICLFCNNFNLVFLCTYVGQEELVLAIQFVIHSESLLLVSLMWKQGGNICP